MRFYQLGGWMFFSALAFTAPLACSDSEEPEPEDTGNTEDNDDDGVKDPPGTGGGSMEGLGGASGLTCSDFQGCGEAGVTCDGDELVICAELFDGCLTETRTDCAVQPDGACTAVGKISACTLPAKSPCEDKELCMDEGLACSEDNSAVVKCARDEDGCLVPAAMDCELGTACEDAECVATCQDAKLCGDGPGKFCGADGQIFECKDADLDGCLDALVDTCELNEYCGETEGDAACGSDASSCEAPIAISGLGSWFYQGESVATNGDLVELTGTDCTTRTGAAEMVFEVALEAGQTVKVNEYSSADVVLSIQTGTCGSGSCLESNDAGEATTGASYTASAKETVYAIVEKWSASDSAFDVAISTSVCGDGVVTQPAEACDDMNATAGDGCTECQVDPGYACSGAPSACVATDGGSYGAGVALPNWPLDVLRSGGDFVAEVTFTEDVTLVGSARDPAADLDVAIFDANGETVKTYARFGDEAVYIQLPAGVYTIGIIGYGSTFATDPVVSLSTIAGSCGDGTTSGEEKCDDANAFAGDGCNACTVEPKFVCGGSPSICANYTYSYDKYFDDGFIVDADIPMMYPQNFWSICTISSVYIRVDIDHDYRGDLDMRVQSPEGTWVTLTAAGADDTEDYIGVFPLAFPTVGNLADFSGEDPYGEWTLEIIDDAPNGSGWINDWEIYVDCQ